MQESKDKRSTILSATKYVLGIVIVLGEFCRFKESCNDSWVTTDVTGLEKAFRSRVFGQHLVTKVALNAVKGHVMNKSPKKALVLSFNGGAGSGKNFVSKLIAKNLFTKGLKSKYVHQIIATNDFPHQRLSRTYRHQLKSWVVGNVSKYCSSRSMFIFDEMDKMPTGVVDVLTPYMEPYPDVKGVDYRKTIFIFLSNTGGDLINEEALKNWKKGKSREEITIKQMDRVINQGAFNTKGSFWHSSLIEKNLVDYCIPFLPMERTQVKQCAEADMKAKNHVPTANNLDLVADEMQYYPKEEQIFSTSGCKKVSSKVDLIMG